jgi:hypothetical protein
MDTSPGWFLSADWIVQKSGRWRAEKPDRSAAHEKTVAEALAGHWNRHLTYDHREHWRVVGIAAWHARDRCSAARLGHRLRQVIESGAHEPAIL